MMIVERFFRTGPVSDPLYAACRDHDTKRPVRARVECMWRAYRPYCPDEGFLTDAQTHFVSRSWELYLGATFLRHGFRLLKPPPKGPDILIPAAPNRIWVEAVAASAGEGEDAVPSRDRRGRRRGAQWTGRRPTENSLMLRCTNGITSKLAKLEEYRRCGIIGEDEPAVIALTLGGVEDANAIRPGLPIVAKALFGVGELYMSCPVESTEEPTAGYFDLPAIRKRGGKRSLVGTTLFCTEDSASVAAVLYSAVGIWNAPRVLGSDLVLVHNPFAKAPLPRGVFPFAQDYFVDTDGCLKATAPPRRRLRPTS